VKKALQFPIIRIVLAILLIGLGTAIGQIILNLLRSLLSITNPALANILAFAIITPIVYFAYTLYVRWIEKREVVELGFSDAWQELGLGALVGFGLLTMIMVLLWILGLYRVTGIEFNLLTLLGTLLGAFVSAIVQELIFRAAIYRITEEWLGIWWALGISAAIFGLIHLSSDGATLFSALAVALQAGVILAAAYALTHRLWMALGLHMAWDFANDGIFGVGVAGQSGQSIKGLLQASLSGPPSLTGGALGVEASIISLVIVLLAGFLILRKVYQQSGFITRRTKPEVLNTNP
jgi:membrane protease YdiL (CAAX protease family)